MKTPIEERIAETLRDRASIYEHPMPKGTAARVRARQVLLSAATATLVAVVVVAAFSFRTVFPSAAQPGSRQTVPAPSGVLPDPQGSQGGTTDSAANADPHASPAESTLAHGTNSTVPYTEQVEGQEAYLLTQKHPVGVGHINGVEWSLAAYDTHAYTGDAFAHFLGGNCGDLMVGDQGEYGGITFCLQTPETSSDAQFAMAGFGNGLDPHTDPIIGYAGLVGPDVSSVELRLDGERTQTLPLYEAPSGLGIDARYFTVFVGSGDDGRIVALGSDGSTVGSGGLCITQTPSGSDNQGCGHGLMDVSSVVARG